MQAHGSVCPASLARTLKEHTSLVRLQPALMPSAMVARLKARVMSLILKIRVCNEMLKTKSGGKCQYVLFVTSPDKLKIATKKER